jgi:hypothetical protein
MEVKVDHARNSMLREVIVEHEFIGQALKRFWVRGVTDVEVLRSESDSFGYDLVMARGKIVRHIQLKALLAGGKAAKTKVGLNLLEKPSGCVIWIVVTRDLEFDHFLWFGGPPGQPLPDIRGLKVAKHTKGDSAGRKGDKPAHRLIPHGRFERLMSLDAVLVRLFGSVE